MKAFIQRTNGVKSAPIEATFLETNVEIVDFKGAKRTIRCAFRLTVDEALKFFNRNFGLQTFARPVKEDGTPDEEGLTLELYTEGTEFIVDLMTAAYGQFSDDGLAFVKNEKLRDFFRGSRMCEELLRTIYSDPEFAIKFRNGLLPEEFMQNVKEAEERSDAPAGPADVLPFPAKDEPAALPAGPEELTT